MHRLSERERFLWSVEAFYIALIDSYASRRVWSWRRPFTPERPPSRDELDAVLRLAEIREELHAEIERNPE